MPPKIGRLAVGGGQVDRYDSIYYSYLMVELDIF